jgi:hypothetical protein
MGYDVTITPSQKSGRPSRRKRPVFATGGFVPIFGPFPGGLHHATGGKIMSETTRLRPRREKVFGPARGIPLDGNAKARIKAFVQGYNARYRQKGQHL